MIGIIFCHNVPNSNMRYRIDELSKNKLLVYCINKKNVRYNFKTRVAPIIFIGVIETPK